MQCTIPPQNVKVLSRGLLSLSKIGDEMFIDAQNSELSFRTVNLAQSALGEFKMRRNFFSLFEYEPNEVGEAKCKITMKSVLSVIKSLHSLDKHVENFELKFKPSVGTVVFQIHFNNSSIKKYFLPIIDSEALEATYTKRGTNVIVVSSKLLSGCLKTFRVNEEEIALEVSREKLAVKNHLDIAKDNKGLRTETGLGRKDFVEYTIREETRIAFCMKELRAIVSLAEPGNLPVRMSFSVPGEPLVVEVQGEGFEGELVMATLGQTLPTQDSFQIPSDESRKRKRGDSLSQEERLPEAPPMSPERSRLIDTVFLRCFSRGDLDSTQPLTGRLLSQDSQAKS